MKKKLIVTICIILVVAIAGGGIFAAVKINADKKVVEVLPVSYVMTTYWGDESSSEGQIISDLSQTIYLQNQQEIKEIYVHEGDTVSIGTPLVLYDTTLAELDLEMQKMQISQIDLKIEQTNRNITNLKNGKVDGLTLGSAQSLDRMVTAEGESEAETNPPETDPPETEEPVTKLDYDTVLDKYPGTINDIYQVVCIPETVITKEFIHLIRGYNKDGSLITEEEEPKPFLVILVTADGIRLAILNGMEMEEPSETAEDTTLSEFIENEYILNDTAQGSGDDDLGDDGGGIVIPTEPTYTQDEINQMLKEQQSKLTGLQTERKQAELDLKKLQIKLDESNVISTVNGVVKSVGEPDAVKLSGDPLMVVTSESGLYLRGYVNEFDLENFSVGQTLSVQSWESGSMFDATVTEISPYPTTSYSNYGTNANSSTYEFTAYIADPGGLRNSEWVSVTFTAGGDGGEGTGNFYVMKAYIREENGEKYVYISDENGRLKKQYLVTGKTIWNYYIEIISGITEQDLIAFPYGKDVKEGVRTKQTDTAVFY